MAGNTFGTLFKVTTFGESHGEALGVIIDGCPAGTPIDINKIQEALDKRRPGAAINGIKTASVTSRNEPDKAEILSGVFNGIAQGTPIAIVIKNTSQHSNDYGNLATTFRPGHADYTYDSKYGTRDYRGGGRSSGRETAARVAAGAIAKAVLDFYNINVIAFTTKACGIEITKTNLEEINQNTLRAPDNEAAKKMEEAIEQLRSQGESAGGIVKCIATGVPAGLGEPVFDKLDAQLAKAMLSIGAIKGIEFGKGFDVADSYGSTNNDIMTSSENTVEFLSNNAGGILGGISNGNTIEFSVAVKPVPSIFKVQNAISKTENGYTNTELQIKGRHDVCLCPRIVPVVEAMTNIVLADMILLNRASKI